LIIVDNRYLIAGAGIKISKEAGKMPAVKRLHQDSDNSGKTLYIIFTAVISMHSVFRPVDFKRSFYVFFSLSGSDL